MMDNRWDWIIFGGFIIAFLLIIVAICGLIGLYIYAAVAYGNTPVSELPGWVIWLWRR